jgi:Secretion system C-terminal sorting domain
MKKYFLIIACVHCAASVAQTAPPYPTAPAPAGIVNSIEYFIDSKPEFGSGTPLTGFAPAVDVNAFSGTVNVSGLAQGFHRIYFRSKEAGGKWSLANNAFFDNYTVPVYAVAPAPVTNITDIEYFIDSKPEFGSGTALTGFTPSVNVNGYNGSANVSGLAQGFHRFYIRSKDANGIWSITNNSYFDNYTVPVYATAPAPATNITGIEYFIDSKPEFGSGTAFTGFTPSPNISGYNGTANVSGLPQGFHRFYIRSKDATGKWSITNNSFFDNYTVPLYNTAPAAPPNIVALEYFIDNNDLGFGNCTPIPVTPNTNIAGLNANINVTGLVQGVHRVFIRSKDVNGKWSLTNFSVFDNSTVKNYPAAPSTAPAVSNMEYFIDTDPGFGAATPITVPGNTGDVNNYAVNLNLSGSLSSGTHYLCIRSKQNPWSLTNIVPFTATGVTPVSWLYIKAQLVTTQAQISWATAQEINAARYEIEHSADGSTFIKAGEVAAAGNSNNTNNYSFTHINPVAGLNYYRIKQIDRDGSFKYSIVVTVLKREGIIKTIIAPNPVKNILTVIEPSLVFTANAAIYSSNGMLVMRKIINSDVQVFSMPVSNLPAGSYILKLQYKNEIKAYPFMKD